MCYLCIVITILQEMKENKDIKIRSVSLKSFKGFDDVTIDCMKSETKIYQWTVLLGNNNTGKTRILQAIAQMSTLINGYITHPISDNNKVVYVQPSWRNLPNTSQVVCNITDLENTWMFFNNKPTILDRKIELKKLELFGYGVSRYPTTFQSLSERISGNFDTLLYHDTKLTNIEEWLMQLDYAAKSNSQTAETYFKKVKAIICSGIFPEIEDIDCKKNNEGHNYMPYVLFKTKDGWFRYNELGFGYQSMLSWVVDLCKRMFETFPNSKNPLLESAVVLVDEIDLHLHPKWQREIISYVSDIFKNVQFIVTTHSPLIIQSMQEVNLYVLRREDEKIVVEHSSETNFSGWTVEEILRDTMKLDNDIQSDFLQNTYRLFDEGLDNNDVAKAREAYNTLIKILHPNNPARRLLKLQLSQMEIDDKD